MKDKNITVETSAHNRIGTENKEQRKQTISKKDLEMMDLFAEQLAYLLWQCYEDKIRKKKNRIFKYL